MKRLQAIDGAVSEANHTVKSGAIFIDMSVVVNALSNRKSLRPKTFIEFVQAVHHEIKVLSLSTNLYMYIYKVAARNRGR